MNPVIQFRLEDAPADFRMITWEYSFTPRGLRSLAIASFADAEHRFPAGSGLGLGSGALEPSSLKGGDAARFRSLKRKLSNRLQGERDDFDFEEFDLSDRGQFHLRAWKAMREIPFGETATYGEIAERAGSPLAFRAAGQACNANRIILFIPCHRVVAANGLGGFACGLGWKKKFLALENPQIAECASAVSAGASLSA